MTHQARPVGGPILTRPFLLLLAVALAAAAVMVWRFVAGLGATTALSDGYPWGLWITFDVVTGTALATGGYAVAILAYVLNRGRYHPLVRPAVLTSALGYSLAGFAIMLDVGRYWNLWKVPLFVNWWNLSSVLLEVALCVMAYIVVLWIELAPAFLERWQEGSSPALRRLGRAVAPRLDKALVFILAFGLLLPTMHQSSLGSVMLLTTKLHPLWHTPLLPLLFLLSCIGMGYAVVVFESTLSSRNFGLPSEAPMLASLGRVIAWISLAYLGIRVADLALRGRLGLVGVHFEGLLFVGELLLFAVPALLLLWRRFRDNPGRVFAAAQLMMLAGAAYRFDAYLVAYNAGPGWSYFPSVPEILVTAGIVAIEVMAYIVIVKRFPILIGAQPQGVKA